jgi:hypothetical protein
MMPRAEAIHLIKINGVEPFAYIADVIRKIAEGWPNSRIDALMPWQWTAQPQQVAA